VGLKIKFPTGIASASNKPPPSGSSPDPGLFVDVPPLSIGPKVWRAVPVPDRIRLVGYFRAEYFKSKLTPDPQLDEEMGEMIEGLSGAADNPVSKLHGFGGPSPFKGVLKGQVKLRGTLALGPRESRVWMEIRRQLVDGAPQYGIALEFNPRKLGHEGHWHLAHTFAHAAKEEFHVDHFLYDTRISRLDVALDFSDVRPAEIILTAKKEGQRVHYLGADGALETVQLHGPTKTKKGQLGRRVALLYDRNRERAARGKPEPYPGRQITRLEITKTRFHQKGFGLSDLPALTDPFKDIRLSYGDAVGPFHDHGDVEFDLWRSYLALRLGVGDLEAIQRLGESAYASKIFQDAYRDHPSNLLAGDVWAHWHKGLAVTGLALLVDAATTAKDAGKKT
jgi:hypothetical protein